MAKTDPSQFIHEFSPADWFQNPLQEDHPSFDNFWNRHGPAVPVAGEDLIRVRQITQEAADRNSRFGVVSWLGHCGRGTPPLRPSQLRIMESLWVSAWPDCLFPVRFLWSSRANSCQPVFVVEGPLSTRMAVNCVGLDCRFAVPRASALQQIQFQPPEPQTFEDAIKWNPDPVLFWLWLIIQHDQVQPESERDFHFRVTGSRFSDKAADWTNLEFHDALADALQIPTPRLTSFDWTPSNPVWPRYSEIAEPFTDVCVARAETDLVQLSARTALWLWTESDRLHRTSKNKAEYLQEWAVELRELERSLRDREAQVLQREITRHATHSDDSTHLADDDAPAPSETLGDPHDPYLPYSYYVRRFKLAGDKDYKALWEAAMKDQSLSRKGPRGRRYFLYSATLGHLLARDEITPERYHAERDRFRRPKLAGD